MRLEHFEQLDPETLEQLADKISEKLFSRHEKEVRTRHNNIYHNTRLLLNNYHQLKAHTSTVNEQILADTGTIWNNERLNLNSLMENKAKAVKLMKHVDNALSAYRKLCYKNQTNGYQLINAKYIDSSLTDEQLGIEFNVTRQAVAKQLKRATDELAVILFGPEAIKFK